MRFYALAAAMALAGCTTPERPESMPAATFNVTNAEGSVLGKVDLVPAGDGYRLSGRLGGLPTAGILGMHLHTRGACEGQSFSSAGAHLNPRMHQHGTLNPQGAHLGDLPNVAVSASGEAAIEATLPGDRVMLDRALFDTDGTALVVHASADDYRTDPSGNSGARIACGTLVRR